ncbi:MAG: rod-binding protein [Asticcacaulis sp.]
MALFNPVNRTRPSEGPHHHAHKECARSPSPRVGRYNMASTPPLVGEVAFAQQMTEGGPLMDTTSLLTLQAAQTSAQTGAQSAVTSAMNHATKDKNAKLGLDFETMCLSNLLSPMFEGLSTDGPFGGGQGEAAVRSFYIDAMARNMARRGGIGISDMMQKQLIRMQES